MSHTDHHVAVLGATPKPERFANKAIKLLLQHGYTVLPVHPKLSTIEGLDVTASMTDISEAIDTLTLYVGPARLATMIDEVIALKPGRVIFNPGTEFKPLQEALDEANIPWQEDCTLILLNNDRF